MKNNRQMWKQVLPWFSYGSFCFSFCHRSLDNYLVNPRKTLTLYPSTLGQLTLPLGPRTLACNNFLTEQHHTVCHKENNDSIDNKPEHSCNICKHSGCLAKSRQLLDTIFCAKLHLLVKFGTLCKADRGSIRQLEVRTAVRTSSVRRGSSKLHALFPKTCFLK